MLTAAYSTPQLQAQSRTCSRASPTTTRRSALPFTGVLRDIGALTPAGLYSTRPSNDAHYFTGTWSATTLRRQTRINLNGRYGDELQNNVFPANTADPNLPSSRPSRLRF